MSEQKPLNVLLDEIEKRADKATPGPWKFLQHWGPANWQGAILYDTKHIYNAMVLPLETCTPEKDANGEFIAAARTDVPKLVKALREGRRRFLVHMGPEAQLEAKEYDVAIYAILNGEEADTDKNLGEHGAE